jgi:membrane protease YdiL (CAAX protease family)
LSWELSRTYGIVGYAYGIKGREKPVREESGLKGVFNIKEAVLLCFFVIGLRFLADLVLLIAHVSFPLVYDLAFLGIVLGIAKRMGKKAFSAIFAFRTVPVHVFCSLLIMFLGFEIINSEVTNILAILLPVPEGFFGWDIPNHPVLAIISLALFPAFTEEVFFRGIILARFAGHYPEKKALLFSALLFALMHINPWQAVHAFVMGLFVGWIYLRFRSIWLCMFIHCYNNILASFMIFPVKTLPNVRDYSIMVHPLWFDILGVILFGTGLFLLLALGGMKKEETAHGVP